jgi:hypothetical protein
VSELILLLGFGENCGEQAPFKPTSFRMKIQQIKPAE